MKTLTDNFNVTYPEYASMAFSGACDIEEPDNIGNPKRFQKAVLTGLNGFAFPHNLMKDASSFAKLSNHNGGLGLDCDRVLLFEYKGQKYILFCELKSNFDTSKIYHAKEQIIGSSVKMRSILDTLQNFEKSEYKVIGLIVSFKATDEQITALSSQEDSNISFAVRLQGEKKYHISAIKANHDFAPLEVGDIDLYYVGVPNRQTTYIIDISTLLP